MQDIDLLAIVTRPDFQSGIGPIEDHLGLSRFAAKRPSLVVRTIVLNHRDAHVHIEGGASLIAPGDEAPIDLARVRLALYMPVSLEVEETNFARVAADEPYPRFAAQQWRPLTEYVEHLLQQTTRCVNTPGATRRANNKLIQLEALRRAGLVPPLTAVSTGYPRQGALAARASLVRKNVSEGGWKSSTEFSPARLVGKEAPDERLPAIWQIPIQADHEYRVYVMGDEVIFVRLEREAAVTDVRITQAGRPRARIVEGDANWRARMLGAARALDLDYAVVDAMPVGDDLAILEVNANGVWWFLPADVANLLEGRFHAFLDRLLADVKHPGNGSLGPR
ncbi:MAG: hypothetical protein JO196_18845 [Hyphomicrobiales bacterium]|nr:hypothetical protein [Hyphomicrobiales bacterium]